MATSISVEGCEHYRPIYVDAKIALVDDIWVAVGSGNLNNCGMRDDIEMNVATLDADFAQGLRLMLQAEHLGLLQEDDLFDIYCCPFCVISQGVSGGLCNGSSP